MKFFLYTKGGHHDKDPGTSGNDYTTDDPIDKMTERKIVVPVCQFMQAMMIKDICIPVSYDEDWIPDSDDSLTLTQSIEFIKKDYKKRGLKPGECAGIDVHCDWAAPNASGVRVLYRAGDEKGKKLAALIAEDVAKNVGVPNLGTLPDTSTPRKRLGILRDTPVPFVLIEMGFINKDLDEMKYNPEKYAASILRGFEKHYGVKLIRESKDACVIEEYAQQLWNKADKDMLEENWVKNAGSKIGAFARLLQKD